MRPLRTIAILCALGAACGNVSNSDGSGGAGGTGSATAAGSGPAGGTGAGGRSGSGGANSQTGGAGGSPCPLGFHQTAGQAGPVLCIQDGTGGAAGSPVHTGGTTGTGNTGGTPTGNSSGTGNVGPWRGGSTGTGNAIGTGGAASGGMGGSSTGTGNTIGTGGAQNGCSPNQGTPSCCYCPVSQVAPECDNLSNSDHNCGWCGNQCQPGRCINGFCGTGKSGPNATTAPACNPHPWSAGTCATSTGGIMKKNGYLCYVCTVDAVGDFFDAECTFLGGQLQNQGAMCVFSCSECQ